MSLYTTTGLLAALAAMDRPTAFLRDTFFPNVVESPDEEVAIDRLLTRRKMAPFVSPDVPAKERAIRGRKVETFKPAYVKPMSTIRPNDLVKRAHGERFGGGVAPASREADLVNQILLDHEDEITRREEWMCAQILRTGSVTVEGEDYESQVVDFQRPAGQTVALTLTDRWGEADISPLDNIRAWATTTQKACGGAVSQVVMGAEAAAIFQKDANVREILDNRRQSGGAMQLGPVSAGAEGSPMSYLGSIGQFDFWTYSQWFEDDAGNEVEVWPEYGVGLLSPSAFAGNMAYGAILDMDALVPMARFPDYVEVKNPSRRSIITQSAPLPVPSDVTGSFFATVR